MGGDSNPNTNPSSNRNTYPDPSAIDVFHGRGL